MFILLTIIAVLHNHDDICLLQSQLIVFPSLVSLYALNLWCICRGGKITLIYWKATVNLWASAPEEMENKEMPK